MKGKQSLLLGFAATLSFVLPATAAADTATFGSTLQASHNLSITNQRAVQLSTASPTQLVAPAYGLVTEWAVRSSDVGAEYELAVIHHPVEGLSGVVTADDGSSVPVPDATNSIRHYIAGSFVIVDKGDSIALGTLAGPQALPFHSSGSAGDIYGTYGPPGGFSLGATFGPPTQATGKELLLQATEHFCSVPSLQGLKLAIAKQELSSHECGYRFTAHKVKARRKRGRVLSQSVPPGTDLLPQAVSESVVQFVVGKKRKHH